MNWYLLMHENFLGSRVSHAVSCGYPRSFHFALWSFWQVLCFVLLGSRWEQRKNLRTKVLHVGEGIKLSNYQMRDMSSSSIARLAKRV